MVKLAARRNDAIHGIHDLALLKAHGIVIHDLHQRGMMGADVCLMLLLLLEERLEHEQAKAFGKFLKIHIATIVIITQNSLITRRGEW